MPPIRFRIRTVMIVVASLAVGMAMVKALRGPFFENMVMFTAAVVFLAAATVVFLVSVIVFLVAVVRDLCAFAAHFWRCRTRLLKFPTHVNSSFRGREPGRSRGPDGVQ